MVVVVVVVWCGVVWCGVVWCGGGGGGWVIVWFRLIRLEGLLVGG